jgi:MOSC domain-containing protein YiiM
MPHLVSITYTPQDTELRRPMNHFARVPVERARLAEFRGIEDDLKGGTGERQLNVMCAEVLDQLRGEGFQVGPGQMGEQIVIAGVPAESLTVGTRMRIGETAVIEVTLPRTGCDRFERVQGKPRSSVQGRLGVMARVVAGGEIAVGDEVVVVSAVGDRG